MKQQIQILVKVTLARRSPTVEKALLSHGAEHIFHCEALHKLRALVPVSALKSLVTLPGTQHVSLEVVSPGVRSDENFLGAFEDADWPSIFTVWSDVCSGTPALPFQAWPKVFVRGTRTDPELLASVRNKLALIIPVAANPLDADLSMTVSSAINSNLRSAAIPVLTRSARHKSLPHWGLHPSVAWALGEVANLKPSEVVLDPCSGVAALLLELANHWPSCRFHGLDIDVGTVAKGRENSRAAKKFIDLRAGDATFVPFADSTVDVVISDLPFGRQYGSVQGNSVLYPSMMREMFRVLRPNGRSVLLTGEECSELLAKSAVEAGMQVVAEIPLRFGAGSDDLQCVLFCLGKASLTQAAVFNLVPCGLQLPNAERWQVLEKWRSTKPLLETVRPWNRTLKAK